MKDKSHLSSLRPLGLDELKLELEKSLMFFHAYMYGPLKGKRRIYKVRGVRMERAVMSSDWEVLASILVDDLGTKLGRGVDLAGYEVKSASRLGGFEYQYHKNTGKSKLKKDIKVGHLFFSHWDDLDRVEVRYIHGSAAKKKYFNKWLAKYPKPYPQRYRNIIPFSWVKEKGTLILEIIAGEPRLPR